MRKISRTGSVTILLLGLVGLLIAGCSLPAAIADTAGVPAPSLAQESQLTPIIPLPTPGSASSAQEMVPNADPTPLPDTQDPYGAFDGGRWGMHGNWGRPRDNQSMLGGGWGMHGGWGMGRQNWGMGMMGGNRGSCCGANEFDRDSSPGNDAVAPVAPEEVSFMNDIQPMFNERCVACHGTTVSNEYKIPENNGMKSPPNSA